MFRKESLITVINAFTYAEPKLYNLWSFDVVLICSRSKRRKPLPKLVYNLLSDKELRKKVAEVGLPIQGDRKVCQQKFSLNPFKLLFMVFYVCFED